MFASLFSLSFAAHATTQFFLAVAASGNVKHVFDCFIHVWSIINICAVGVVLDLNKGLRCYLKEGIHMLFGCVIFQDRVCVLPHHVVDRSDDVCHLL